MIRVLFLPTTNPGSGGLDNLRETLSPEDQNLLKQVRDPREALAGKVSKAYLRDTYGGEMAEWTKSRTMWPALKRVYATQVLRMDKRNVSDMELYEGIRARIQEERTERVQDDATFNAILDEIRMGDQFGDTMDPTTIQKFGAMQGVEGIIMGRIAGVYRGVADSGTGVVKIEGGREVIQVRVSMQAYAVETGQLLWGAERMAMAEMLASQIVIKRDWIKQGARWLGGGLFAYLALWRAAGPIDVGQSSPLK